MLASRTFVLAAALMVAAGASKAQCALALSPSEIAGADAPLYTGVMWDPDGAGPAAPRLVIGGEFAQVVDTPAARLAAWDPATDTWSSFGAMTGISVNVITPMANGDLVVSGAILTVGGAPVSGFARLQGTTWSVLPGMRPDCMLELPNGDLLVARNPIVGQYVGTLERWNGSTWSPFAPTTDGRISAMLQLPNGDIVAAGQFTSAGGVPAAGIARWDGSAWSPFGAGTGGFLGFVNALAVMPNGDIVAGGIFTMAGGQPANHIARWDGSSWSPLGSGVNAPQFPTVNALLVLPSGDLLVGGYFDTAGGAPAAGIARWSGGTWSALGSGVGGTVRTIVALPNGDVVAGGALATAGGAPVRHIARWNGSSWSAFGTNLSPDGNVLVTAALANGDLVVGGVFTGIGGVAANRIARRSGSSWSPLGSGTSGAVSALTTLPNGDVVAGGQFATAGGVPVSHIARWNGSAWSPLGGGVGGGIAGGIVSSLATMPNGDVVAGGLFGSAGCVPVSNIARWDGTSWSPLGAGQQFSALALAVGQNGELFCGSASTFSGSSLEVWNGSSWTSLGAVVGGQVATLCVLPDGDLVAGGNFVSIGGIGAAGLARWNGSTWTSLQLGVNSSVRDVEVLPNGNLLATGVLGFGGTHVRMARWDGASWTGIAPDINGNPSTLAVLPQGEVAVGLPFSTTFFATLATTCPATAVSYGNGCVGSAGANQLTATALPWVGSSYRGRATGMPPFSFVAVISGFTQLAVPLTLFLGQAGPGCLGYVTGDVLDIVFPAAGVVTTQVVVPNQLALVGFQFHQYVVPFEFDALGTLLAVTSSNALTVTVGHF